MAAVDPAERERYAWQPKTSPLAYESGLFECRADFPIAGFEQYRSDLWCQVIHWRLVGPEARRCERSERASNVLEILKEMDYLSTTRRQFLSQSGIRPLDWEFYCSGRRKILREPAEKEKELVRVSKPGGGRRTTKSSKKTPKTATESQIPILDSVTRYPR